MSKGRATLWAVSIGVLAVVLAASLFRIAGLGGGAVFVALIILCVALLAGTAGLLAEIPPLAGLGGGVVAAAVVAAILGLTIAAAPIAPGAERPGLRDLLWLPLFGLLAFLSACAVAGYAGVRTGLRLARRRRPTAAWGCSGTATPSPASARRGRPSVRPPSLSPAP